MKTIEQLYNGFYLDKKCENTRISNCETSLRVAPIKKVNNYENLEIDYEHFAFAERNENGEIEYFNGLKNFLWVEKLDLPPIFIFDNHNHAPVFRYYSIEKSKSNSPILVHIDQHSDCWKNKKKLELNGDEYDLENLFHFYNEKCNVGNFILPSLEVGIISDQIQIRSIAALKNLKIKENHNFILDIDLDFCLTGINRKRINEEAIKILKEKFDEIGKLDLCTTIATSPYFLNQELAIEIIEELLIK